MNIIHTTSFLNQEFASDAHIFSATPIDREAVSDLLYAQMVVEVKWLGDFPMVAFGGNGEPSHCASLFEDVKLVYPEDWEAIDKMDAFLINNRMYDRCKMEKASFVNLK